MSEQKTTRWQRILLNLDALGCTLISNRAKVGEYISTYVWRVRKYWAIKFIDRLMKEPGHCSRSFEGQQFKLGLMREPAKYKDVFRYGFDDQPMEFTSTAKDYRAKFDEESA